MIIKEFKNYSKLFLSKIYSSILLIFLIVILGIVGFHSYLGFSIIDAIYMTVITISTVGYGEVQKLDDNGKMFTIFLILVSLVVYTYSITNITNFIINRDFIKSYKYRKMLSKIQKLKNHTIICGLGKTGRESYRRLVNYKKDIVVIEKEEEVKKNIFFDDKKSFLIIGNALDDETLELANVRKAAAIITTFPSDSDNLLLVLSARQKNNDITIISRASIHSTADKLKLAGANNVIMPDILGGNRMASIVISKDIVEFLEELIINESAFNLSEIEVEKLPEKFINKSLKEIGIRQKTNCQIIGIKMPDNKYSINPNPDTILEEGMRLITIGKEEEIQKLNSLFSIN